MTSFDLGSAALITVWRAPRGARRRFRGLVRCLLYDRSRDIAESLQAEMAAAGQRDLDKLPALRARFEHFRERWEELTRTAARIGEPVPANLRGDVKATEARIAEAERRERDPDGPATCEIELDFWAERTLAILRREAVPEEDVTARDLAAVRELLEGHAEQRLRFEYEIANDQLEEIIERIERQRRPTGVPLAGPVMLPTPMRSTTLVRSRPRERRTARRVGSRASPEDPADPDPLGASSAALAAVEREAMPRAFSAPLRLSLDPVPSERARRRG